MGVGFLSFEPQRLDEYARIGLEDETDWSMGPQECLFICSLLAAIRARVVVEIGTHRGHASLFICHALRANAASECALHTFEITKRAAIARAHLKRFGYGDIARVHQMDSRSSRAAKIRDRIAPIDALLVDGDHSFEGSYGDFVFWADAVRPKGIIIFHDISEAFEQDYHEFGSSSVFTTLRTIEAHHPGYAIMRMEAPFYHDRRSMGIVQKLAQPAAAVRDDQTDVDQQTDSEIPSPSAAASDAPGDNGSAWDSVDAEQLRHRPWEALRLPIRDYPVSMLQLDELRYLYWLARDAVDPNGLVVELGAWQGGSTAVLAQGIGDRTGQRSSSKETRSRVRTYDRFIWDEDAVCFAPDSGLELGDDMQPLFDKNIAPWSDVIEATKLELEDATWDPDDAISLLFIDAARTPSLVQQTWNTFGPGLREGSVVVYQDYKHARWSFLPVLTAMLPGLRPAHVCRDGCSVAFCFGGGFQPVSFPALVPELVNKQYERVCAALAWDPLTAVAVEYGWIDMLIRLGLLGPAREKLRRIRGWPICAGAGDVPAFIADRLAALQHK